MRDDGAVKATCDQCQYGCADSEGGPVKKPTSFMTNAPELAKELGDRCNGRGGKCSRILGPKLIREARQKQLYFFNSKNVWALRAFEEARRKTGMPPVLVRRVDVNKGGDLKPNICSRLVARQIRQPGKDATFAPTPA